MPNSSEKNAAALDALKRHAREFPKGRLAEERDRRAQPAQALLVDRIDHPERRRVRRDVAIQVRLVTKRAQVRQAVTAIGEHPSLSIGPLLETHKHDVGDILREAAASAVAKVFMV